MHKYKIISLLLFVFTITAFCGQTVLADDEYRNPGNGHRAVICDDADLLSDNEEASLLETMSVMTEYGNVGMITVDDNIYGNTAALSQEKLEDLFGVYSDSTVFVIDMFYREIYIYSEGKMYDEITSSYANTITDNVYKSAHNGYYYDTAHEAFGYMTTILKGGKIAQPMKYISNFLFSVAIGFFICFCVILKRYSIRQASYSEVIGGVDKKIDLPYMRVLLTNTKKIYDPPSSSGGSRGGGGGSHGGGGGHSF